MSIKRRHIFASTDLPVSYKGLHKHVKDLFNTEEFKKKYPKYKYGRTKYNNSNKLV